MIKAKKQKSTLFAYMFAIMDLKTRMYIAFGSSKYEIREGGQGNDDAFTYGYCQA